MRGGEKKRGRLSPEGVPRVLLLIVGVLLVLLALSGVPAYFVAATSAAALAPASTALLLLAAAAPALAVFAVVRQWWGAGLAAALLVLLVVLATPLYVAADAPARAKNIVVMTSNMQLGLADADDVVRQVRAHHVDVLMAEELTAELRSRLRTAGLDDALPHSVVEASYAATGTGLWSRYPLTRTEMGALTFRSMAARVSVPGLDVKPTVAALHLAGPVPDATNWSHDIDRLPGILRALPTGAPVLVGGDFNSTYSVKQFRRVLAAGYADAGDQAGAGLLPTYPSDRLTPVIGIDHVLTRGGAVGRTADTLRINGSDHRALLVTVALPES